MDRAMDLENAWDHWWDSQLTSGKWKDLHKDAARAAFEQGWNDRAVTPGVSPINVPYRRESDPFEQVLDIQYNSACHACNIEAMIGTEEVPHPVDARLHTCREPDYKCAVCGSTEVQHAMWVDVNTEVVRENFGSWCYGDNSYCPRCAGEGRDPHPNIVARDGEPTARASLPEAPMFPLVDMPPKEGQPPVLTVELRTKWFRLWLLKADGSVDAIGFENLEKDFDSTPYVDHVPNPEAVANLAKSKGYQFGESAKELITGRWFIEVQCDPS